MICDSECLSLFLDIQKKELWLIGKSFCKCPKTFFDWYMEAISCKLRHKCNVKWNEDDLDSNHTASPTTKSIFRLEIQNRNNLHWMIMVVAMKTVVFVCCSYNQLTLSRIIFSIYFSWFSTLALCLMDCSYAIIGIIWIFCVFPGKDIKKHPTAETGISNIYCKDSQIYIVKILLLYGLNSRLKIWGNVGSGGWCHPASILLASC